MARPSVRTLLPDLQGTLTPRTILDLPGLSILRLTGKLPRRVRPAVILFPVICLTDFHIKNISRISKFILLFAFPFLASSSSSSPSELSEGPASDGSSQALAARGSNQQDSSGVATAAGAAGSSQAAGPGPTSSVSVATPAPRITPINNGPLPPGYIISNAKSLLLKM